MPDHPLIMAMEIPSRLENVTLVGLAIHHICTHHGCPATLASQIETAVVEAANNAIEHAYEGRPDQTVRVQVTVTGNRLAFQVTDRGRPMESVDVKTPDFDPADIQNIPQRGMGLYIIHQVMDTVTYTPGPDGNILFMEKELPQRRA